MLTDSLEQLIPAIKPGFNPRPIVVKINITLDKNSIEISAETATDTDEHNVKGYVHRERTHSKLYRSMEFPEPIVPEKAEASYENGMLEVKLPKKTPTAITKHKVTVK